MTKKRTDEHNQRNIALREENDTIAKQIECVNGEQVAHRLNRESQSLRSRGGLAVLTYFFFCITL